MVSQKLSQKTKILNMKKVLTILLLLIVACSGSSEETALEDTTTTTIPPAPTSDINYIELYNTKLGTELCSDAKEIDTTSEECLSQYKENLNYLITLQNKIGDFGSDLIAYYETYPELVNQEYKDYINFVENVYSQVFLEFSDVENKYIERFGGLPVVNEIIFNENLNVNCPVTGYFKHTENLKTLEVSFANNSNETIVFEINKKISEFRSSLINSGGLFKSNDIKATNFLDEEFELENNFEFFVNHMFHRVAGIEIISNNLDYEDLLIIEILIEHTSPIENVSIAFFDPFSESIYSEIYTDELIKIDDKTSKAVLSAYLLKEDLGNSRKRLSTSESAAEIYLYDQVFNHRLSTVHIISGNTKDSLWTDSYNLANGISFPLPTRCGSLGQHEIKNIDYENLLINTNF
jgi:hypothetical protein